MGVESPNKQIMIIEPAMTLAKDTSMKKPLKESTNSVKRSLFGKVNHEEVMAFFQDQLANLYADKMQRWNFDFVNEQPIRGGNFEWEKVTSSDFLKNEPSTADKVTKFKISCHSSTLITSHWSKCKKINRHSTFAKNIAASRKTIHKTKMERIK